MTLLCLQRDGSARPTLILLRRLKLTSEVKVVNFRTGQRHVICSYLKRLQAVRMGQEEVWRGLCHVR